MIDVPIRAAQPGDYALFKSGPRRIEHRWAHGLAFVAIATGFIGNYASPKTRAFYWRRRCEPDGQRQTAYTWSDLRRMGVQTARRH